MLTKDQYLLIQTMSECSEVIHAITKALQFGLDDNGALNGKTNLDNLIDEVNDLKGSLIALNLVGINLTTDPFKLTNKLIKIEKYYEYARSKGLVE